jgi:hypothetical protein
LNCREAKYLQLIGVHIPEAARTLLLQEEKFKFYFTQLAYAVRCSLPRNGISWQRHKSLFMHAIAFAPDML